MKSLVAVNFFAPFNNGWGQTDGMWRIIMVPRVDIDEKWMKKYHFDSPDLKTTADEL